METIHIDLPDEMKAFVENKIGPGRLHDASAYVQLLIAEAMDAQQLDFSEEQRERIDQMLLQAEDSLDQGKYARLRPGELEEVARG
jgi:Arc/MetJ-type ribon-helix-helix transcriptional regulator